ncbi:hypothetical protein ACFFX0_18250 [Citricoccus parietis]|uniref:Uncharacterized protein n=1 Tax=Citricoccus parietis TaxID=592307 RepID=A0ABV5G313_9MICC
MQFGNLWPAASPLWLSRLTPTTGSPRQPVRSCPPRAKSLLMRALLGGWCRTGCSLVLFGDPSRDGVGRMKELSRGQVPSSGVTA